MMKGKWKSQRLLLKLTLMILLTIILTISLLYFLLNNHIYQTTQNREEEQLLQIGEYLAKQPIVVEALQENETNPEIQEYTNQVQENFQLDFVVVMTMERIRLTHPDPSKIHQLFQGGDELEALLGKETTSIAEGTLGQSLRAFVPVFDDQQHEIGVVSIGITTATLSTIARQSMEPFTISFLVSFLLGICAAAFMAYTLKQQMHNLEPAEIGRLLEQRNAMLDNTKDAIIVTDKQNKIILSNVEANNVFLPDANTAALKNLSLKEILPDAKDVEDLTLHNEAVDQFYHHNGNDYLVSMAPIIVRKKIIGQIAVLRDATELYLLTDQLFNTSNYATILQTQSHDFLNKLHVIYGLTDLEDYDELKSYLGKLLEPEQEFSQRMFYLVHNPIIAGFLIGERSKFTEKNYPFMIEIYPDIPSTSEKTPVQCWITIIRVLNRFILEHHLGNQLHIRLEYWSGQLITTYELQTEDEDNRVKLFEQHLNASFISQLLKKGHGHKTIETGSGWIKACLKTEYHEEET